MQGSYVTFSSNLPHHIVSLLHQKDAKRALLNLHRMLPTDVIPREHRSGNCKDVNKYVLTVELWKPHEFFYDSLAFLVRVFLLSGIDLFVT